MIGSYSVILNFSCQNFAEDSGILQKLQPEFWSNILKFSHISLDTSSKKDPTSEKQYKKRKEDLFRDLYGLREEYDLVIVGAGLSG